MHNAFAEKKRFSKKKLYKDQNIEIINYLRKYFILTTNNVILQKEKRK